jgi:hypothetical protein
MDTKEQAYIKNMAEQRKLAKKKLKEIQEKEFQEEENSKTMSKLHFLQRRSDRKACIQENCNGVFYTQHKRPPKELFYESEDDRTVTETAGVRSTFERIVAIKRAGIMLENYRKEHYDINPGTEEEDYIRLHGLENLKVQNPTDGPIEKPVEKPVEELVDNSTSVE